MSNDTKGAITAFRYRELLKGLMSDQRSEIDSFFREVDLNAVEAMLEALLECKGIIFFSGVGKSGIIAEKLAVTMASTGTRALFVPPINALHGDLGIVSPGDLFILISKSGESEELLNLIPFVRNKGAHPVAWVSNHNSRLEKACDSSIYLPVGRELCPFNLAPTTSTAVQLIFGDILAMALMKAKGFSLVEYAQNHPAGRIGRRTQVRVSDLMLSGKALPLCRPQDRLISQLVELSDKRCGCLLVVDEEWKMVGIFTDGDLRRALQRDGSNCLEKRLEELMIRSYRWIGPNQLAWDAMKAMESNQKSPIMVLPVLQEDSRVMGLIKMHDIVQAGIA